MKYRKKSVVVEAFVIVDPPEVIRDAFMIHGESIWVVEDDGKIKWLSDAVFHNTYEAVID